MLTIDSVVISKTFGKKSTIKIKNNFFFLTSAEKKKLMIKNKTEDTKGRKLKIDLLIFSLD